MIFLHSNERTRERKWLIFKESSRSIYNNNDDSWSFSRISFTGVWLHPIEKSLKKKLVPNICWGIFISFASAVGKRGDISDTLGYASCGTFLFLPHFDVICDLLLNRRTATWNLFVKYFRRRKRTCTQYMLRYVHLFCLCRRQKRRRKPLCTAVAFILAAGRLQPIYLPYHTKKGK